MSIPGSCLTETQLLFYSGNCRKPVQWEAKGHTSRDPEIYFRYIFSFHSLSNPIKLSLLFWVAFLVKGQSMQSLQEQNPNTILIEGFQGHKDGDRRSTDPSFSNVCILNYYSQSKGLCDDIHCNCMTPLEKSEKWKCSQLFFQS